MKPGGARTGDVTYFMPNTTAMNYYDAVSACASNKGYLPIATTSAKMTATTSLGKDTYPYMIFS